MSYQAHLRSGSFGSKPRLNGEATKLPPAAGFVIAAAVSLLIWLVIAVALIEIF